MRAALYETQGPAREVLSVREIPDPEPGPGEVRVRLEFSGVNPTDWRSRIGGAGPPMSFDYQVPGQDGAGMIDMVGQGVSPERVGQRVWVFHGALRRQHGTAAEYIALPEAQAVPLPDNSNFEQGAGLGIPFITAHLCLFDDGTIADKNVLVAGGAGAVGNAAIQLGKYGGARVIATVSNESKAELARAAGADEVLVDYRRPDAAGIVKSFSPDGIDRIVEVALTTNLTLDLAVLKVGGTVVTYARAESDPTIPVFPLMTKNARLHFVLVYSSTTAALNAAVTTISDALRDEALAPLPSHVFPLDEIAEAHEAVEANVVGKVLLDMGR